MSVQKQRLCERFDEALRSADPFDRLRDIVRGLLATGHDREALYAELQRYVADELRVASRDKDEDIVLDVMDCLVGWCAPEKKL